MDQTLSLTVRPAVEGDLADLDEIYGYYVRHTAVSFDLVPPGRPARAAWLARHSGEGPHRILVGLRAGAVAGYASSSPFRPRAAYQTSIETSVYCAPWATGQGLGRVLYRALFDSLTGLDLHRAYAGITLPNPASVALHRRLGFHEAGVLHEAGRKFDQYWSVLYMEKDL